MIKGNDNILAWVEANGNTYWTIKHGKSDNGSPVAMSLLDHNYSMTDSLLRLSSFFKMMGNTGSYYIITRQNPEDKGTKGVFNDFIELGVDSPAPQVAGIGGFNAVGYVSADDVKRQISEALEANRKEQTIAQLQSEIAEQKRIMRDLSKNTIDERFGRIMGILEPYIPNLLGMVKAPAVAVGSVGFAKKPLAKPAVMPDVEVITEGQENEAERFRIALEGLSEVLERNNMHLIDVVEQLHKNSQDNERNFLMGVQMIF